MGLKLSHVLGGVLELLGTNSASSRTITFPDKDMTVAGTNDVIGVGQTWQSAELTDTGALFTDGTPSYRAKSPATYTNNTGKPIKVTAVSTYVGGSASTVQLWIDGILIQSQVVASATGAALMVSEIIPDGSSYYVVMSQAISTWAELR